MRLRLIERLLEPRGAWGDDDANLHHAEFGRVGDEAVTRHLAGYTGRLRPSGRALRGPGRLTAEGINPTTSLREAKRRSNPRFPCGGMDCFASLAKTAEPCPRDARSG